MADQQVVPNTAGQQTIGNYACFLFVLFVTDAHEVATRLLLEIQHEVGNIEHCHSQEHMNTACNACAIDRNLRH